MINQFRKNLSSADGIKMIATQPHLPDIRQSYNKVNLASFRRSGANQKVSPFQNAGSDISSQESHLRTNLIQIAQIEEKNTALRIQKQQKDLQNRFLELENKAQIMENQLLQNAVIQKKEEYQELVLQMPAQDFGFTDTDRFSKQKIAPADLSPGQVSPNTLVTKRRVETSREKQRKNWRSKAPSQHEKYHSSAEGKSEYKRKGYSVGFPLQNHQAPVTSEDRLNSKIYIHDQGQPAMAKSEVKHLQLLNINRSEEKKQKEQKALFKINLDHQGLVEKKQNLYTQTNDHRKELISGLEDIFMDESVHGQERSRTLQSLQSLRASTNSLNNARISVGRQLKTIFWVSVAAQRFIIVGRERRMRFQKMLKLMESKRQFSSKGKYVEGAKFWVRQLLGKVLGVMTSVSFYSQYHNGFNPKDPYTIDTRKIWVCNFIKFVLQNLEIATRAGNFPENLHNNFCLQLFADQHNSPSLFVSKRVQYLSLDNLRMLTSHKKVIFGEHLIFNILLPYMFEISNNLLYQNNQHINECKVYFTSIASYLQLAFKSLYSGLPLIGKYKGRVYQRHLVVGKDLHLSLVIDERVSKDQDIITGLYDAELFQKLFEDRIRVQIRFSELLTQIISNLASQIKV